MLYLRAIRQPVPGDPRIKNRFGAANEIGVFAMEERGLREVRNPSAIFLSRSGEPAPGSVVTVAREGTRQMLIEIQALVDATQAANPRRVAVGFEANRVAMLLAVLHSHAGLALHGHVLSRRWWRPLGETAADSQSSRPSRARGTARRGKWSFLGFGLTGEIRPVPYEGAPARAAKHGFGAVAPK